MNQTQKNILMISVVLILVAFGGIYLYLGQPLKDARDQVAQLQSEVSAKETRLSGINEAKTVLPDFETSMQLVDAVALPKTPDVPNLIEQIERLVMDVNQFDLISFTPTLTQGKAAASSASGGSDLTLIVKGDTANLGTLLDSIYQNARPLKMNSLSISPEKTGTEATITLQMTAYVGAATSSQSATSAAGTSTGQ